MVKVSAISINCCFLEILFSSVFAWTGKSKSCFFSDRGCFSQGGFHVFRSFATSHIRFTGHNRTFKKYFQRQNNETPLVSVCSKQLFMIKTQKSVVLKNLFKNLSRLETRGCHVFKLLFYEFRICIIFCVCD